MNIDEWVNDAQQINNNLMNYIQQNSLPSENSVIRKSNKQKQNKKFKKSLINYGGSSADDEKDITNTQNLKLT